MPNLLRVIMGNSVSLEEELINLRMTSKQMQRASKKCLKNEKDAVIKVKKVRYYFLYIMHNNILIINDGDDEKGRETDGWMDWGDGGLRDGGVR
jgi:hypothetical protein